MEDHIKKLEKEKKTIVFNKLFKDVKKVEKPHPNVPVGYSNVVEVELLTENLEQLIYIAMTYAPSAMEII